MKHEKLYISGMTCINCQTRIASALNNRSGITEVSVSYETGTAEFSYDPEMVSLDRIITMIDDLGYETSAQNTSKKKVILRAVREIVIIAVLFFTAKCQDPMNKYNLLSFLFSTSPPYIPACKLFYSFHEYFRCKKQ